MTIDLLDFGFKEHKYALKDPGCPAEHSTGEPIPVSGLAKEGQFRGSFLSRFLLL
jgi:hypothetical protein